MKILLLLVLFLALAGRGHADPKIFLESVENDDHPPKVTVTEWYIEPGKLDQLPAYDPAAGNPPLSIADAIKTARVQVDKTLVPKSIVTLDSVELHQIDRGNIGETVQSAFTTTPTGKWYYKVTYSIERPDPKFGVYTYPLPIYVLMDNTVSERRDRPQTKEEISENQQMGDQIEAAALEDAAKKKK